MYAHKHKLPIIGIKVIHLVCKPGTRLVSTGSHVHPYHMGTCPSDVLFVWLLTFMVPKSTLIYSTDYMS